MNTEVFVFEIQCLRLLMCSDQRSHVTYIFTDDVNPVSTIRPPYTQHYCCQAFIYNQISQHIQQVHSFFTNNYKKSAKGSILLSHILSFFFNFGSV